MGVPSFYKWLVRKYPQIVVDAVEEKSIDVYVDVDSSLPNPNKLEFDNFYLDMNGIIHHCFHPDDDLFPPTTYEEVFRNIYKYIDRLFNIVRPRKLLYLAIDGVAPRAKMNQQRARRFRTAKDKVELEEEERKLREKFEREGKKVLEKEDSELSDSNVITPGTMFMYSLSEKLQSYIRERISTNPGWKNIKVILSDSNVPGEGEHKIMSFIRAQRPFPDYNPNTRHCLYGLDADLIMLALASHELHFSVLREDVLQIQDDQSNHLSSLELSILKAETSTVKRRGWFKKDDSLVNEPCKAKPFAPNTMKGFQFLNVWVLREYLDLDIRAALPEDSKADLERIVDDFVFICFFAGNDFLPRMPTLEIHEGALDLLLYVYKKEFSLCGYLVDMERVEDPRAGYIKLSRVEKFILSVGSYEQKIFDKRVGINAKRLERMISEARNNHQVEEENMDNIVNQFEAVVSVGVDEEDESIVLSNTRELKQKLKEIICRNADTFRNGVSADKVKLGDSGWREQYYTQKFGVESREDIERTRSDVVAKYTEGLHWVLLYYYKGVPSWNWFYPYHYGPFASDLKGMSQTKVKFQNGIPFKPFDQLMSVLPPWSAHAVPDAYRTLMEDENSNIIDFYPTDLHTDMDGKRFAWQGIVKLPFIDEERLLTETRKLDKDLVDLDQKRNTNSADQMFMWSSCKLALDILSLFKKHRGVQENDSIRIESALSGGVYGTVWHKNDHNNDLHSDTLCVFYRTSPCSTFISRVLTGTEFPEKIVFESDIAETALWHEYYGRPGGSYNNRYQNRNVVPNEIDKGFGCGWAGRGKNISKPEFQNHCNPPRYIPPNARNATNYSQPIGSPSNLSHMPRSPRQENPWRMPRPQAAGPSDPGWTRWNAVSGNSWQNNDQVQGRGRGQPSWIRQNRR